MIFQSSTEFYDQLEVFQKDESQRYAFLVQREDFQNGDGFGHSFFHFYKGMNILKEDYVLLTSSWLVTPESNLYETVQDFLLKMHEHGFIKHFDEMQHSFPVSEDGQGPQVLTMYMLSAGFIVWLATILLACIAFICEHIYRYFTSSS
jgi:hypothetical protein